MGWTYAGVIQMKSGISGVDGVSKVEAVCNVQF